MSKIKHKEKTCMNCRWLHRAKANIIENGNKIKDIIWVCKTRWIMSSKKTDFCLIDNVCEEHEYRCEKRRMNEKVENDNVIFLNPKFYLRQPTQK